MIFFPTTRYLDKEIQWLNNDCKVGLDDDCTRWGQDYTWDKHIHRHVDGPHKSHIHPSFREQTDQKSKGQGEDIFEWIGDFISKKMLDKSRAAAEERPRETSSK